MKTKKLLAALTAGAAMFAVTGLSLYAAPLEGDEEILDEFYEEGFEDGFEEAQNTQPDRFVDEGQGDRFDERDRVNPRTGNSSAAFIAIPAAIAAAAVVAKKSKFQ
ncbi:MAG: hypothetical protein FWG90_09770 [Oscillospiraceae bacterium]|nr:hypothetical protein [Oscillospiraceae bacterium]